MEKNIYSMGIDIGTATTQIIFSEIKLEDKSDLEYTSKFEITEKNVIYKSDIYLTPFANDNNIDIARLKYILENEFVKSSIKKESMFMGTIILTGEAASEINAEKVSSAVSDFKDRFIVVTAGPDLEAVLAGNGVGASKVSKEIKGRVLNYDIGGGTANISVFNCGELEDAFAMDIGGGLIRFDEAGNIKYISPKIQFLIKKLNLKLAAGEKAETKDLLKLCYRFSTMLLELCGLSKLKMDTLKLFIEHKNRKLPIDYVTFSGGISEYIYKDIEEINDSFIMFYKDIGPILGFCIKSTFKNYKDKILWTGEKINATAIGAANYSFVLSGNTVTFDEELLPLRNIPLIKAFQYETEDYEKLYENVENKLKLHEKGSIALSFKGPKSPSYEQIKLIASEIMKIFKDRDSAIVVIVENNFAEALGKFIKLVLNEKRKVICIDGISTENGDYIDIGIPLGETVPINVKTLVFNN